MFNTDSDVYRCEVLFTLFGIVYVCFVLFLIDVTVIKCIIQ